jgi:hypothetical protein
MKGVILINKYKLLLLLILLIVLSSCSNKEKDEIITSMLSDTENKFYLTALGASPEITNLLVDENRNVVVGYYSNEHPSEAEIKALEIKKLPIFIVFDTKKEVFRTNDVIELNEYLIDKNLALNERNYESVRKAAWEYLIAKGWNGTAEDWNSAVVTKTIASSDFELIDRRYEGQEILSVTFADKENVVIGTPIVLVDELTHKVIGYKPGE